MMGLKVLSVVEWLASHILIIGGLTLITIGLLRDGMALSISGIWAIALGTCIVFGAAFKKLATK